MSEPIAMSEQFNLQEEEYEFPYHYIPTFKNGNFSQTIHWSWGFRYLGGIKIVMDCLKNEQF